MASVLTREGANTPTSSQRDILPTLLSCFLPLRCSYILAFLPFSCTYALRFFFNINCDDFCGLYKVLRKYVKLLSQKNLKIMLTGKRTGIQKWNLSAICHWANSKVFKTIVRAWCIYF